MSEINQTNPTKSELHLSGTPHTFSPLVSCSEFLLPSQIWWAGLISHPINPSENQATTKTLLFTQPHYTLYHLMEYCQILLPASSWVLELLYNVFLRKIRNPFNCYTPLPLPCITLCVRNHSCYSKGPIRFCHFQEKTKSLTSDLWLKEGIWHRLKILRCSLVVDKPLWFLAYVRCLPSIINPILAILSFLQSDKIW